MGARRWLSLPLLPDLQTSELAKMAIIVAFAGFLADGVALRSEVPVRHPGGGIRGPAGRARVP